MNSITMYVMDELSHGWFDRTIRHALAGRDLHLCRRGILAVFHAIVGAVGNVAGLLLAVPAADFHSDLGTELDGAETING